MGNVSLKLYSVDAVMLVLGGHSPDPGPIKHWKENNIKTAFIYTDKKARNSMMESGNLEGLADVESFLSDAGSKGIRAMSAVMTVTSRKLDTPTERTVLLSFNPKFIKAAQRKNLAMMIGFTANENAGKKIFYDSGAGLVLDQLDDVAIHNNKDDGLRFSQTLPNLFSHLTKFYLYFGYRKPIFFFDYDGTLTPIINDPEKAVLANDSRGLLNDLSKKYHVAVVSGRDINAIKNFIGLDNIIYAGSHGFRVSGPKGISMQHEKAGELLSELDDIENLLREKLETKYEGVRVERKKYAIAVHYRNAPGKVYKPIQKVINEIIAAKKDFKKSRGKKIIEVRPSLDWHKGKAVQWILEKLKENYSSDLIPVYTGDDITDEDAFRTLADDGITILVGEHGQPSAADYCLNNVGQVKEFLHFVIHSEYLTQVTRK